MVQAGFADARKSLDQIRLTVDIPPEMSLPASRKPLVMALRNFIKNAHEAILEDESRNGVGTIHISARQDGDPRSCLLLVLVLVCGCHPVADRKSVV